MPSAAPSSCVVLVPISTAVEPDCDESLRELERRGYAVRRLRGGSAIDSVRNQMATDALGAGFAELMWIDSDIVFDPQDVERLRDHQLPITCGLYPKKGPTEFACEFPPSLASIRFGTGGGLAEVRYCGSGFVHVRREVYEAVSRKLNLPVCNQRFGCPLVPYYAPTVITEPEGVWSLPEDFAFCERVRRCGFKIFADTRIRLWHVGSHRYGWEDAASHRERFDDFTYHRTPVGFPPDIPPPPPPGVQFTQDWFSVHIPLWKKLFASLVGQPVQALEIGVFEGRSAIWMLEHVLIHPDSRLTWIDPLSGGSDHHAMDLTGLAERLKQNLQRYSSKVHGHVGRSQEVLRGLADVSFDVVYLDGSHEAPDVLADAVLVWPLLKPGGLLGFDDYRWQGFPESERRPALAIDAFLRVHRGRYEDVHRGYQVWIRKLSPT
ncbi:MAG: class I SAM-dependent methyltransferase [Gemmataceae bacterium]